jgi:hypothetical protein
MFMLLVAGPALTATRPAACAVTVAFDSDRIDLSKHELTPSDRLLIEAA